MSVLSFFFFVFFFNDTATTEIYTLSLHDALPITAVACDPSDGSVWIGPQDGGIVRLKSGTFTSGANLLPDTAPEFATKATVRNIQIDRWATPRTVYFAHLPYKDATGTTKPGGVTAYSGP